MADPSQAQEAPLDQTRESESTISPPQPQQPFPDAASPQAQMDGGASEKVESRRSSRRKLWTTNPAEGVDLIIGESGLESEAPITVGRMFKDTVERIPDHAAHMYKENGEWITITYKQHYDRCFAAAKSFLKVRIRYVYFVIINDAYWAYTPFTFLKRLYMHA